MSGRTDSDLIDRQAAIDALIRKIRPHNNGDGTITMWVMSEELVRKTLNDLPSAQPERKTGEWIPQNHNRRNGYVTTTVYYYPKCSKCGYSGNYGMNYCPHCGAFMGGEQDEAD